MSAPWYRCFPRDFNEGMVGLTLEERGAYITLLNLIYSRGGPIPEDQWWITSQLGCTTRQWVKIRAALIVKRKLFEAVIDGEPHLMNGRAVTEIAERREFSEKKSCAGKKGGQKAQAKRKENNELGQAELDECLSTDQAIHNHIHRGSVVPSNDETTGGEAPSDDLNKRAWSHAVGVLVGQGAMTSEKARAFFGKLLSANQLEARDLLGPLAEAENLRTPDPQGYLTKAATARGRRRQTGPPKRVGFV